LPIGLDADADFQRPSARRRTYAVGSPHWLVVDFYLNWQMLSGQECEFALHIVWHL
jgi:hypothetical protein